MRKFLIRLIPILAAALATLAIGTAATGLAAYYYLLPGLQDDIQERVNKQEIPLRVYSRDGRLVAQLGEKRRTPIQFDDIPKSVVNAFLAAEDDRFFVHPGFDYQGIVRAGVNLLLTGSRSQGGSTITQQLAREYFLTRDRTFLRKAKELILAIRFESEFSKQEILALYLNAIFLGQRAYGVASAAEVYFGKSLDQVSIAQAAAIAGLPAAPSRYNPVSNPVAARERRAYVLRRMLELDFIDRTEFEVAMATPMESRLYGPKVDLQAPYVAEMVRREMIRRYGLSAYTKGYKVVTTIDSRLQDSADKALHVALLEYDRRHGYRGPVARLSLNEILGTGVTPNADDLDAGNDISTVEFEPASDLLEIAAPEWASIASGLVDRDQAMQTYLDEYPDYRDLHLGIVISLTENTFGESAIGATGASFEDETSNASALIYIRDAGRVQVPWKGLAWRRFIDDNTVSAPPSSAHEVMSPGDIVYLLNTADQGWRLAQMPEVQGALVALDPQDGAIVALTGGFEFYASKYNRATQSKRQPGSSFKPFIYSAALENGFTAATIVNDAPVVFDDPTLEDTWRPENYSRRFYGPTRLREGLVRSMNLVSVRVLLETGVDNALEHIKPFGFPNTALPRDPSLALGSGGASPLDMAAGFAALANGGHRINHYLIERIEELNGRIVFQQNPPYVCDKCQAGWFDSREQSAPDISALAHLLPQESVAPEIADEELTDPPDEAQPSSLPPLDAEIPSYLNTAAMKKLATDWRPDQAETPEFFSDRNQAVRIVTPQNAYIVYDMMRDVIREGTGRRARELGRKDLAGKTGTSNDRRDAWFSGFNRELVAVAWVGFDVERSLGANEEGSRTALPAWKYFMAAALEGLPEAPVPQPPGIVRVRISPETGLIAPAGNVDAMFEIFRDGHVPKLQPEDPSNGKDQETIPDDEYLF